MSLFDVFNISGSAMSAHSVRLNTTASNLANAESIASSPEEVYKSRQPVFQAVIDQLNPGSGGASVRVTGIVESKTEPQQRYEPEHPMANEQGYIYTSNINAADEMANMIAASRAYQNNVEVMKTSKQMLLNVLRLGQ